MSDAEQTELDVVHIDHGFEQPCLEYDGRRNFVSDRVGLP